MRLCLHLLKLPLNMEKLKKLKLPQGCNGSVLDNKSPEQQFCKIFNLNVELDITSPTLNPGISFFWQILTSKYEIRGYNSNINPGVLELFIYKNMK